MKIISKNQQEGGFQLKDIEVVIIRHKTDGEDCRKQLSVISNLHQAIYCRSPIR